ncbi:MAG: phosphomannomutase/phosphoglucomutase [Candidatus Aquicultorales bacterium]
MIDQSLASVFRQYDIRGIADRELTREFAERLGKAYAVYARGKLNKKPDDSLAVAVGRDVRLSSEALRDGLIDGLVSMGAKVFDVGVCPTPLLYFALFNLEVEGGIMITGSHNPPEYNGFKVCVGKDTIHGDDIQALSKVFLGELGENATKGSVELVDMESPYLQRLEGEFGNMPDVPLRIAVDAGNGTGGLIAKRLLEALGCEVVPLYLEPDGDFPNHHPDPTVPAFLEDLANTVSVEDCDLGVAFDGDADRIGAIDESGNILWGDKLMIFYAAGILERQQGVKFVGEVKCSQVMYDEIARLGGRPIMWKTGHSLIKEKIKVERAVLAGEMSGHFFFADRYYGYDDALYAAARLVEGIKLRKAAHGDFRLSGFFAKLPLTYATPELRVDCPDSEKHAVVEKLKEDVAAHRASGLEPIIRDIIDVDGIRIVFEDGWGLVRVSNTQPVIVLRFEASTPEQRDRLRAWVEARLQCAS